MFEIKKRRFIMNTEKKLNLEEIKVQSFTTTLDRDEQREIKGGSVVAAEDATAVPIYC